MDGVELVRNVRKTPIVKKDIRRWDPSSDAHCSSRCSRRRRRRRRPTCHLQSPSAQGSPMMLSFSTHPPEYVESLFPLLSARLCTCLHGTGATPTVQRTLSPGHPPLRSKGRPVAPRPCGQASVYGLFSASPGADVKITIAVAPADPATATFVSFCSVLKPTPAVPACWDGSTPQRLATHRHPPSLRVGMG